MGRGPHDHQAVISAQRLLFGPRRSRQEVLSPVQKEKKSEMAKMGKKRARERTKDEYIASWNTAAADFAAVGEAGIDGGVDGEDVAALHGDEFVLSALAGHRDGELSGTLVHVNR